MDPEKITYEMVSKKAREIAQARGKRSTVRTEQLEMLQFLIYVAKGPVQKLEVCVLSVCLPSNRSCACSNGASSFNAPVAHGFHSCACCSKYLGVPCHGL